jgi:SAM-dependent methyltransferase
MLMALHSLVQHAEGIDSSKGMVRVARETLKATNVSVTLGRAEDFYTADTFDIVISHLSLQAIESLSPLMTAIRRLLSPDGCFVFSIPHPCFWNSYQRFIPDEKYNYMVVTRVVAPLSVRGEFVGMVPYIHRPLSKYFQFLREAQLSVALLEEIVPEPEIELLYQDRWVSPRYAVFHCIHKQHPNAG